MTVFFKNFKLICCSTDKLLERELKYLEKVFHEKNNYPKYIVKQILDKAFEEHSHKNAIYATLDEQNEAEHTTEKKHMLVLPYQSKKRRLDYQINEKEI